MSIDLYYTGCPSKNGLCLEACNSRLGAHIGTCTWPFMDSSGSQHLLFYLYIYCGTPHRGPKRVPQNFRSLFNINVLRLSWRRHWHSYLRNNNFATGNMTDPVQKHTYTMCITHEWNTELYSIIWVSNPSLEFDMPQVWMMSGRGRGWSPGWGRWGCWQQSRWWTEGQCWHRQSGTGRYFSKWYKNVMSDVWIFHFKENLTLIFLLTKNIRQMRNNTRTTYAKELGVIIAFFKFQNHFFKNCKACPSSGCSNMIDSTNPSPESCS